MSPWDCLTCPTWDSGIGQTNRIEGASGTDGSPWDCLNCLTWDSGMGLWDRTDTALRVLVGQI